MWNVSWLTAMDAVYPCGSAIDQADLSSAITSEADGLVNQSLRMIVSPGFWRRRVKLRFGNPFGSKAVRFSDVHVGLHASGGAVVGGTNVPVTFDGRAEVTIAPGESRLSDAVDLAWLALLPAKMMEGRAIAVSFHVPGTSGRISWHSKAMTSSYVSSPGSGCVSGDEDADGFPHAVMSWMFIDSVWMETDDEICTVLMLGDSFTDGTGSTVNGSDRWPDALARRLRSDDSCRTFAVLNAGIGGNTISARREPGGSCRPGGDPVPERLSRDVLWLPKIDYVIWLQGINDFTCPDARPSEPIETARKVVRTLRRTYPVVKVHMGTVASCVRTSLTDHAAPQVEVLRREFNALLRGADWLDGVIDFDAVLTDPDRGGLRDQYVPSALAAGKGDGLHPNRAGYLAMADTVNLSIFRT